ncbi:MAG: hypothetical protein KAI57_00400 [Candidatus Pacebacteria bacterium]|nr:hypothetical protein [Candidatus Paceibacterota bacterium]
MNKKTKTFQKFALLFLVVLVGISFPQNYANAGVAELWDIATDPLGVGKALLNILQLLIYGIGLLLLGIVAIFVEISAWLIDVFLDPKIYVGQPATAFAPAIPGVLTSNSILIGWTVVRDICNMFFMFFLLIVAFGTMLRSKSINIKAILPKIIISLFLINFSMVFAYLIIDISQFFMIEISSWMTGGFALAAQSLSTIPNGFKSGFAIFENIGAVDTFMIVNIIFAIIFSVCLVFVYLLLVGFLLIRLVYFAVLIVFSPVAFLGIAFPGLSKYSSQWWSEITKWAIFGPIFIFFVYLSTTMANELVGTVFADVSPAFGFFDKIALLVIPAVVPLVILLMAPKYASDSGVAGAQQLVGGRGGLGNISMGSYGVAKWGAGKTKQAGAWGGRRIGYDSRRIGDSVRGGTKALAGKIPIKRVRERIQGKIAIQEVNRKGKDRKNIEEKKSDFKEFNGKDAIIAAKGIEAKKLRKGESLSKEDESKFIALIEHAAAKGENLSTNFSEAQLEMATKRGADVDEIAKHDPVAAGTMKHSKDATKSAEDHTAEYMQEHAESGDWKKYSEHTRRNNFVDMVEHIDSKDLQNHIKGSGPKAKKDYEIGADQMMQKLKEEITANLTKGTPADIAKAADLGKELQKARKKIRKVTGNLEISDAERNSDGYRMSEDASGTTTPLGHGEKAPTGSSIQLNAPLMQEAVKVTGGADFKKLTSESKVAYAKHANADNINSLRLKEEGSDDLQAVADEIKKRPTTDPVHIAAASHEILGKYMT